jgi:hypothetical protein
MSSKEVSSIYNALLIFVDIIDSSVYSSILGQEGFAKKILKFQNLFEELGRQYFRDQEYFNLPIDSYCNINSRGDEGLVFLIDPKQTDHKLIYKAVNFSFELKAKLKILNHENENDEPPTEMKIAIGIHYGKVATVVISKMEKDQYRTIIDNILGYNINYAKRIESSSRAGLYSQVFLSKEAANLLTNYPVVFYKHYTSLKGINSNDVVYEVRSVLLDKAPLIGGNDENFLNYYTKVDKSQLLTEPWLKSYVFSVLLSKIESLKDMQISLDIYQKKVSDLVWKYINEDDVILLYWRAVECIKKDKHTRAITIFKKILKENPDFIFALIKLLEVSNEFLKSEGKTDPEVIFIKDTAEELLENYIDVLSPSNQEGIKKILDEVQFIVNKKNNKSKN